MRHGSLFSGIGGFDLAAEWMGWENVFHCEWNDFGKRVLSYYWPNAISYNDIAKTDFSIHRGGIDILTGGFPCQPYSAAGKRLGKEDDRHLWPEMLRAIREVQPRWVVGENVLGLVNWNGGLVFDEVQTDLEAQGYEVQPYVLPAASVGAPHKRDRVWFVAHSNHAGRGAGPAKVQEAYGEIPKRDNDAEPCHTGNGATPNAEGEQGQWMRFEQREFSESEKGEFGRNGCEMGDGATANAKRTGREKQHATAEPGWAGHIAGHGFERWHNFPTQPPVCSRNDGISPGLDGITFSKWRNESIKAAGNAVVPQVVYEIFQAIEKYEKMLL